MIASLYLSRSFIEGIKEYNGTNSVDKIVATAKSNSVKNLITEYKFDILKRNLGTENIAGASSIDSYIEYRDIKYKAKIMGVNSRYKNFIEINMKKGNFISVNPDNSENYTAVIESKMAWNIFNTDNVIGKQISIMGKSFVINGVIDNRGIPDKNGNLEMNIIEKFIDSGINTVYIPVETLLQLDNSKEIDFIQVYTGKNSTIESKDQLENALKILGKDTSNYNVLDIQEHFKVINQKPMLLLFILGLLVILTAVSYGLKEIGRIFRCIKESYKTSYLVDVIKSNIYELILFALKISIVLIAIILTWKLVKFDLYISPEYMPEELIDIDFYKNLIQFKIQEVNISLGYSPEAIESSIVIADKFTSLFFIIGIVLGIPATFIGTMILLQQKKDAITIIIHCIISISISLVIVFLVTYWAGLPAYFEITPLILVLLYPLSKTLVLEYRATFNSKKIFMSILRRKNV